jgi:hypothetical protein
MEIGLPKVAFEAKSTCGFCYYVTKPKKMAELYEFLLKYKKVRN